MVWKTENPAKTNSQDFDENNNYGSLMQNTPPPPSNGQHQIVRQHYKVSSNLHNKSPINQMLTTNSDEGIRINGIFNGQKRFGE